MPDLPIALQMYTVRDDAARDFAGTLRRVAEIGYRSVELAGYGDLTAAELRKVLDDLGLRVAGSHAGIDALETSLERVIEDNRVLGNQYVVCPYLPAERRQDASAYREVANALTEIGARLKQAGLQFAYHNHDFEFQWFDGASGYDIMMESSDPDLVQIELDTFWVKRAGQDPAAYLRKYAGRVPLIHLKDMTEGPNPTFAEVGEGTMDFQAIFAEAETAGAQFYVVEQDVCQRPPLESVRISFENLRRMGMV